MAVVVPTVVDVSLRGDQSALLVTWAGVTQADTCRPVSYPNHTDRSIHVSGTFGGTSVAARGSNNGGTSYVSLRDPSSTVIAITSEDLRAILENCQIFDPVLTGGAGTTIAIAVLFRTANPLRQ